MNVALIMGRGGSKSIPGKNVAPVLGKPLVEWPILAARQAGKIDRVAVTTDCPEIEAVARRLEVEVIERPDDLAQDDSQMVDGILHALSVLGGEVECLVTMHANCATHRPGLIDDCLSRLASDPGADSCVTGSVEKSVHPFRTRKLSSEGHLELWGAIPEGTSSNRQSLDPCVILDGAARAMRVERCFPVRGAAPFPYLGKHILFEPNPGGLDVHDENDIFLTEQYLKRHQGWDAS